MIKLNHLFCFLPRDDLGFKYFKEVFSSAKPENCEAGDEADKADHDERQGPAQAKIFREDGHHPGRVEFAFRFHAAIFNCLAALIHTERIMLLSGITIDRRQTLQVRLGAVELKPNLRQPHYMDIDLTGFSTAQQHALFDLLILAMYADGHLSSIENEQLQKLLAAMGFVDEIDRQREFDAAVTRIRPWIQSIYKAKTQALLLADEFTDRAQQTKVLAAVHQIMSSDFNVSTWESTLLSELRMKFMM